MRRRPLIGPMVASAVLVTLTACSSGTVPGPQVTSGSTGSTSTTSRPTPVTSSATGATSYSAYAFVIPSGWTTDTARQTKGIVTYLKAPQAVSGVIPTFSVATSNPSAVPALDDVVQQSVYALRQQGSTVTAVADRTIGGEPAKGYTVTGSAATPGASASAARQPISQTQYFTIHASTIYVTTITSSTASAKDLAATQDSILASWSWSTG